MAATKRRKTTSEGSVAGLSNALSPGPCVSDGWCAIMSGFRPPLLACTWSCLLVSCFINGWPFLVLDSYSKSSS